MAKCVRCGISGPFVKVDGQGLCALCRGKGEIRNLPKPSPLALDAEQVITRYLTTAHDSYPSGYNVVEYYTAEFDCMLNSLPCAPLHRMLCDAPPRPPESVILRSFAGCSLSDCADFVAFDTETSGLDARAEIVEISAVKFKNFRPVEIFETLCKPYRRISAEATAVNGISNEMVASAPRFAEIMSDFDEFIDGFPLVAHNAPFDVKMLASEGFPTAGRQVYDTLSIARKILRDRNGEKLPSYKLAVACKYCAVLFSGAHRSSADAMAAGLLFLELAKRNFGTVNLLDSETLWKN